ncbi:MAG: exodeoxyribonuclease VII small subunit [Desulfatibacillaceae bacterium]|nr:exodeoxyribonuclease VII small subunit [Desulfatibacillaceae bacterium]
MPPKKMTFETAMKRLEEIVAQMEDQDLPLESAVAKFEEGMELSRFLSEKLDEVQKKVSVLLAGENGNIVEQAFQPSDSDENQ